ncbi:MAG: hypothetical protein Q7V05_08220 [Methanoregula sp.]|nr:hypothetical protein [Methanoregula sp.]
MEYPPALLNNPCDESNRLMMDDLSSGKEYLVLHDIPGMFAQEISVNRILFMNLVHIPAGERDIRREKTAEEISLFTLDPAIFSVVIPATVPVDTERSPCRGIRMCPDPRPHQCLHRLLVLVSVGFSPPGSSASSAFECGQDDPARWQTGPGQPLIIFRN